MTRFPFGFGKRQTTLTLLCISILLVVALAPGCRSAPTLPEGTILLELVDTSQVSVTLPIHEQLLVVAYDNAGNDDLNSADYTIGLLDLANQRFIQLSRVHSYPPWEIEWKPDGTQFIYNTSGIGDHAASTWIFQADGKQLFHEGMQAGWIGTGQYVSVWTCGASRSGGGGNVYTMYDTTSWKAVCQQCDGRGASMECYCGAFLPTGECPPGGVTESKPQEQCPRRYDAVIENHLLRVTDNNTGVAQSYALPNHRIVKIEWSPN